MNQQNFQEAEIPYHILAGFGLDRDKVEDMPKSWYEKLLTGRATPVLPIVVQAGNGDTIRSRARFSLVRMENGEVGVVFYPKLAEANLSRFNEPQQKALYAGETVIADTTSGDGSTTPAYYQLDPETGQVMSVPVAVLEHNVQLVAESLQLSTGERACIKNGKPLSVSRENEMMTIGIDLDSPHGIRMASGDETDWRNTEKRDWGKYNFGLNGCWTMDGDGNIDYVNEEDYSDEMWSEMKRQRNGVRI